MAGWALILDADTLVQPDTEGLMSGPGVQSRSSLMTARSPSLRPVGSLPSRDT